VIVTVHGLWIVFCVGSPDVSIDFAVKGKEPGLVGVPLISPVDGLSESPEGRAPMIE
jgi:hypothetical protein